MVFSEYKTEMERLRQDDSDDEWFFANLCESILSQCEPFEAYEAIESVVQLAVSEKEGDFFYYHIQFLIKLGCAANTSQCPEALIEAVPALWKKAGKLGKAEEASVQELSAWFRLHLQETAADR
ncbi:hypothetical protein [Hahella ganghwensis]|uniref:hypothetical protein n=1 Tax=Hahella ganghwensis TaxID=286420 RepID=UPI00036CBE83|nr:hypothetical protein [Hahella ganghwensis]